MRVGIAYFRFKILAVVFSAVFFFGGGMHMAEAATLFLSPSSGTYPQGQIFYANVNVSTPDAEPANAISGRIAFPQDVLEAVSVSNAGSVVDIWIREPSISQGEIVFEGIILNPGFVGKSGKIVSIGFRGKKVGTSGVSFSLGSVLANDGNGTNILRGFGNASYAVVATAVKPGNSQTASFVPVISSSTHPIQDGWYTNNDPKFDWSLPPRATGVNIFHDHNAVTNPGSTSEGLFASYTYTDLDDGAWYFHVRALTAAGWGEVGHYRFQIDTKPPEQFDFYKDETSDGSTFVLAANDGLSGLSHYEISIDGEAVPMILDGTAKTYNATELSAGTHKISARVFDKAGNAVSKDVEFTVTTRAFGGRETQVLKSLIVALGLLVVVIVSRYLLKHMHFVLPAFNKRSVYGLVHRFHVGRKLRRGEASAVRLYAKEILGTLKLQKHIYEQIKTLEKAADRRHLTGAERNILIKLKQDLDETEALAQEQIDNFDTILSE